MGCQGDPYIFRPITRTPLSSKYIQLVSLAKCCARTSLPSLLRYANLGSSVTSWLPAITILCLTWVSEAKYWLNSSISADRPPRVKSPPWRSISHGGTGYSIELVRLWVSDMHTIRIFKGLICDNNLRIKEYVFFCLSGYLIWAFWSIQRYSWQDFFGVVFRAPFLVRLAALR